MGHLAMSGIELRRLSAPAPSELAAMTFPIYRRLLALERTSRHPEQEDRRRIDPLAIAAWCGGEPAGLVLAEMPVGDQAAPGSCLAEDGRTAQILSVYVPPAFRRRGVAAALVGEMEQRAQELGSPGIAAVYTTGKPAIAYLERIFARREWSPPRPRTLSVRFAPEAALASDLLAERRLRVLGRGLEIFPWSELSAGDRQEMKRSHSDRPWIAPMLVPWQFDRCGFDPSSVGARYRGRVVGWVITHGVSFDTVRFTCSFMRNDLSRRAAGHLGGEAVAGAAAGDREIGDHDPLSALRILTLYAAALERLRATPCRLCTFVTPFSYSGMVEFIRRRLVPIASFVGETREARRSLRQREQRKLSGESVCLAH